MDLDDLYEWRQKETAGPCSTCSLNSPLTVPLGRAPPHIHLHSSDSGLQTQMMGGGRSNLDLLPPHHHHTHSEGQIEDHQPGSCTQTCSLQARHRLTGWSSPTAAVVVLLDTDGAAAGKQPGGGNLGRVALAELLAGVRRPLRTRGRPRRCVIDVNHRNTTTTTTTSSSSSSSSGFSTVQPPTLTVTPPATLPATTRSSSPCGAATDHGKRTPSLTGGILILLRAVPRSPSHSWESPARDPEELFRLNIEGKMRRTVKVATGQVLHFRLGRHLDTASGSSSVLQQLHNQGHFGSSRAAGGAEPRGGSAAPSRLRHDTLEPKWPGGSSPVTVSAHCVRS
ncbi:unnamed protein product [Pleuronectes platessa]|uniref:Uncharacterized protein n=1 Tax=Pleuronectes platessa TaxID=8262 RepID=A0A9N7TKP6_PLEPL|nr:unnamed protein product [Pleuronectes platessa]